MQSLTITQAYAAYDMLMQTIDASPTMRDDFALAVTRRVAAGERVETRVMGCLGMGGKFIIDRNGTTAPRFTYYPEDKTVARDELCAVVNQRLREIFRAR
jgi:hypothetical protein